MSFVILAIGLVLIVEGLVFALAPLRLEDVLDAIRKIPPGQRRWIGLGAAVVGAVLVWLVQRP